jgi:RNA polymerase sigma-70 factor (ECF subfamily)
MDDAQTTPQPNNADSGDDTAVLIARCLSGDQTAYSALYTLYASGVYRLCYSLLFQRQDAEDVTQEAFLYAFRNLRRFDAAKSSFKTWMYTIAVSRCRNLYRRKRPAPIDFTQLFRLELAAPNDERPEAAFAQRNAQDALVRALADLSPQLREAVVLRYGHGMTYREIAAVMDCPPKTAESRVRLAHDRLRGLLQGAGQGLLEELLSL